MLKKLKFLLKNYYKIEYLVEHMRELTYIIDNLEVYKKMDKDIYELANKVKDYEARLIPLERNKSEKGDKNYSIAGVPKGQKDYVLGLIEETGDKVLEEKMKRRGEK